MAIDVESLAAINASSLPYDLFREVHKGLRRAIFAAIEQAGRTDYTDDDQRRRVLARVTRVIGLLGRHHHHEDIHLVPLLDAHAPVLAAMLRDGHNELAATIGDLQTQVVALADLRGSDAIGRGLLLYRNLAAFSAVYLAHMAFVEGPVMGALRDAMNIGDLYSVEFAIRTSLSPDEMCDVLMDMAPAMNIDERATLLATVRVTATPEFFERMLSAFAAALTAVDYQAVTARIGPSDCVEG